MNRKDVTPSVLAVLLLTGIVVLAFLRHWWVPSLWGEVPLNPDDLFAGFYILWLFAEAPIARKDVSTEGKVTSDRGTCPVYAFSQALTILSALYLPPVWHAPTFAHLVGFVLFVSGVLYRLWAIRTLGVLYSHRVRTVARHTIVDSGPYAWIRHPAYAGMIIAHAGVCLYFLNGVTACAFLLALIPSILMRIAAEEKVLFEIEGYSSFARSRKRLFPWIW